MFRLYIVMLCLSLPTWAVCQSVKQKTSIEEAYNKWKQRQYTSGKYATERRCNPDNVTQKNYKGAEAGLSKDASYHFQDINGDGNTDALVTLYPYLCDGGLALSNRQLSLLVLSTGKGYKVNDTFISNIEKKYKGWFMMKGGANGLLYGTLQQGGRTAEKITSFTLDYKTQKVTFKN